MSLLVAVAADLAPCLAIRRRVFVEEQAVPEALEADGQDEAATHLLATWDGRPVGTARLLPKGPAAKVGRVAVLAQARGRGVGAALVEAAVAEARRQGFSAATLGSQVHAIPFYERLGFAAHGPVYDDAGIPHRDMTRAL